MLFPPTTRTGSCTRIELATRDDGFPVVFWTGMHGGEDASGTAFPLLPNGPGMPLLGEHAHRLYTRPHLRGHRLIAGADGVATGQGWSTRFVQDSFDMSDTRLTVTASDADAGLKLVAEFESVAGGALRGRYAVSNIAPGPTW